MLAENRALNKGRRQGAWTPLFLKSNFARDIFLQICFCVILQGIPSRTLLAPVLPESCRGPWKSFKFMMLLEETFVNRKI